MKQYAAVLLGYMSAIAVAAQAPSFISAWHPAGQPSLSDAVAVTTDADGNIYTTGHFMGSGDFDPGPGVVTLTSASPSFYDVYVTKSDATGQLIWARNFGSVGHEKAEGLVVDGEGNVYISGTYEQTADMDPGPGIHNLSNAGQQDIFINKLDTDGEFVYARGFGGAGFDVPHAMALGADDMLYVGGRFADEVNFGGQVLTAAGVTDAYDGFILKLDAGEGGVQWARRIGNANDDHVTDLTIAPDGHIVFTGTFGSLQADFDPTNAWATLNPVGLQDVFVCKWTSDGAFVWVLQMGGSQEDQGRAVTTDATGNIYVTGTFRTSCNFDVDGAGHSITAVGGSDVFIAKYDPDGLFLWAKGVGSATNDESHAITLTSAGHVAVGGYYTGTVDVDPGAGTQTRTTVGNTDILLLGLDEQGEYAWDLVPGSVLSDVAYGLHGSANGDLFAVGMHGGQIDFDPGPGQAILNSSGHRAWALRLGVCTPVEGPVVQGHSCGEPFSWNDNSYTEGGTYQVVLESAAGCDSTVTLQLEMVVLDNTVTVDGITLTAVQTGVSYQWVDCNMAGFPVEGATEQSFTPTENGSYSVVMVGMGCSEQSECINVLSVEVDAHDRPAIGIFPVPAKDHVHITNLPPGSMIALIDAQGRVVRSMRSTGDRTRLGLEGIGAGIYMIRSQDDTGIRSARIVVDRSTFER